MFKYDYLPEMLLRGVIDTNWLENFKNFEDMNLKEDLLKGIYGYGFENPSGIQQQAIIPCVRGHNVSIQAHNRTGKTSACIIALLQNIDTSRLQCQALILVPTRDSALQTTKIVIALSDYIDAQCHTCIGGTNVRDEKNILQTGTHVVVGTPGRVHDMMQRGALSPEAIKICVFDEAEKMLNKSFKEQIDNVRNMLNSNVQFIVSGNNTRDNSMTLPKIEFSVYIHEKDDKASTPENEDSKIKSASGLPRKQGARIKNPAESTDKEKKILLKNYQEECTGFAKLLVTKLMKFKQSDRELIMNEIDNLVFKHRNRCNEESNSVETQTEQSNTEPSPQTVIPSLESAGQRS